MKRDKSPRLMVVNAAMVMRVLGLFGCVVIIGCANRPRLENDPFRRPSGAPPASLQGSDPRYNLGQAQPSAFERANESARQRDFSADVSTDPMRDTPRVADARDDVFRSASQQSGNDPLLGTDPGGSDLGSGSRELDPRVTGSPPLETYERIRERLEEAGARNWKFEKDANSGQTTFSCELPYRDSPNTVRVFEAQSANELKAMLAVTEQVERWVSTDR